MMRIKFMVMCLALIGLAACSAPAATPIAPAAPDAIVTDISGKLTQALTPVPGARLHLRTANTTEVVVVAPANADGRYSVTNPPAGDYQAFVMWPDGSSTPTGIPLLIPTEGAGAFVMPIDRNLQLLEPAINARLDIAPTLRWTSAPGATHYQLTLIDAGTTELIEQQAALTATDYRVGAALQSDRTYEWTVEALDANNRRLGWLIGRFTVSAK